MLVDSHCHLDFPGFRDRSRRVVARAARAGIGRMVTISTRVRQHAKLLAIAERFADVFCSVGTHPHNAHEELDITARRSGRADQRIRRWWRSAKPGSTITTTTARATRRSRASAPISRRRARPGCRWSSMRARPTTTWRGSWRRKRGRGPSRPCCIASPAAAIWRCAPSRSAIYVSFTGILTFKKSRGSARDRGGTAGRPHPGRDRRAVSRARRNIAANATSRLMWSRRPRCWREVRGVSLRRDRAPDHGQFLSPVHQGAARDPGGGMTPDIHHSRLRVVRRRAAARRSAGAPAIPNNPKNRRRRCSLLVERSGQAGTDQRAGRHVARPARTAARRAA